MAASNRWQRCTNGAPILREGSALLRGGRSAMRELVARIAARFVPLDKFYFYNVNREADLEGSAPREA